MMKRLFKFYLVIFLTIFISCKKDHVTPTEPAVTPSMAKDSLYYIMKEWYYWYNMPEAENVTLVSKDNYSDPYALLEAMRYKALTDGALLLIMMRSLTSFRDLLLDMALG